MLSTILAAADPETAKTFFLIAAIVFVVAAVLAWPKLAEPAGTFWRVALAIGLVFLALGFWKTL